MKITVLGCGAIGKLWLAALSEQQHHVQAWLKVPQPSLAVRINTLQNRTFEQQVLANNEKHLAESELLLVCLKAWQVPDAINNLSPKLSPDCPILLLHNGMGTQEELLPLPNPILSGVTTHGAYQENGIVYHKSPGITQIGSTIPDANKFSVLANILNDALPEVIWSNDIYAISWLKLAANCIINPLTVLYDCKNGGLLNHIAKVHALCDEVHKVMKHDGIQISRQTLIDYIMDIITRTSENSSSMRQDIRSQRRTEIDYITGFLLTRARVHGLILTENAQIYRYIKRQEEEYERLSSHLSRSR
ncbi:2-dehydropantoate 2-reductase [Xenorhabdus sp. PB30.3]|uniref:2-dehydropantoate 2-reductase n=1 Tax=Xenorhabdus sp. PB30.3 TaxID=2788941 RepID=UPI001E2A9C57|nr:2-dehydropantoate 2-reductase [Xenorhabdus sp. PB30.3]MCC8379242.1 2-dehydropantoate 2-reductase [Xenorhabdus sp. PB30.3]